MKTCGECGLFCSCGALWPSGLCLPRGDKLILPSDECCVMWEADWRGVDQSDGKESEDGGQRPEGGGEEYPKPEFLRSAGIPSGSRLKQSELF